MELFPLFLLATSTCVFAFIIVSSALRNHRKLPPECKGAWPIIGHLPLLGSSKMPHKVLAAMADTHGPIFTIKLGINRALVISSSELARECLLTNDKAVSGRPKSVAVEILGYNSANFGFAPYSAYWRQMRKIVMLELLSNHRLNLLSHVWKSEVKKFLRDLYALWDTNKGNSRMVLVDLKQKFEDLGMNTPIRLILGKQSVVDGEEVLEFQEALKEFSEHIGAFAIGDALPFLRWLDIGGQEKAMKKTFRKLDGTLQKWLDEHKKNRPEVDQDFMDVMLSILDHEATKDCNYDTDTINKATCMAMLGAGSDTTALTLTWAISLLLNNPHVLKRAQEELATHISKDKQVEESDITRLVYLQAIVKETLRLYPAGPLMAPREFIEDCTINGFNIKTGTKLIVNLHKIFRDPKNWENPLEFRPERFLSTHKDVDVRGKHFEFIPFGAGRRMCPGLSLAFQVVHFTLANLLHGFELSTPSNAPVDMKERFGLLSLKAEPVEVLIAPILWSKAYM